MFARCWRTLPTISSRLLVRHASTMASPQLILPRLPLFEAIGRHDHSSTAIVHSSSGRSFTYGQLIRDVAVAKDALLRRSGGEHLEGQPVAMLVENSYDYVVMMLSIFAAQSIALPMSPAFPSKELRFLMKQSGARMLLSSQQYEAKARDVLSPSETTAETDAAAAAELVVLEKHDSYATTDGAVELGGDAASRGGLMLYTSGTTNRPKGVVLSQSALTAQAQSLLEAWQYSPRDCLLHVLPLHHIHGIMNALIAPLFAGAVVEFQFPFNATNLWTRLATPFVGKDYGSAATTSSNSQTLLHPTRNQRPITFLTLVPTIYTRLLASFPSLPTEVSRAARTAIRTPNLRLPISGSASLPSPIRQAWSDLSSSNVLLERYGMTETGMILSCGLHHDARVDGSVGWPLPGVEVRLVELETGQVIAEGEELNENGQERDGEIWVRGPGVFEGYWKNEAASAKEFATDEHGQRWFKTGDVAVRRALQQGLPRTEKSTSMLGQDFVRGKAYFIRGRRSADIIKSGGEKVSALEVEREILSLDEIEEVAVVAIPSASWGHKVGAAIVLKPASSASAGATTEDGQPGSANSKPVPVPSDANNVPPHQHDDRETIGAIVVLKPHAEGRRGGRNSWGAMDLRRALRDRLAAYKIPRVVRVVEGIPRNAMGKINKKELVKAVFSEDISGDEA